MKRMISLALTLGALLLLTGCSSGAPGAVYRDEARMAAADCFAAEGLSPTVDESSYACTADRLTGCVSLWRFADDGAQAHRVSCEIALGGGRAKLVVVNPDGTVDTLLEVSSNAPSGTSVLSFTSAGGESLVKLVGDNARELSLSLGFDGGRSAD